MLSLVRASLPGLTGLGGAMDKKEAKKKNAISFIMKCRRVFQVKFFDLCFFLSLISKI